MSVIPATPGLLTPQAAYKPFRYPWAYDAWLAQQRAHWLPEEVPLADDVADWRGQLTDAERMLLTQIFRFFTQADVEVNNCYMTHYGRVFQATEVRMMLAAFSATETVHIAAYSHLLDTIGMPETEYEAFLNYREMKAKYDFLQQWGSADLPALARTLAVFGAFTEGVQLFASFAMLLNFPRFNKMKGMGQIITWSVRDETLHCLSLIRLFRTLLDENPDLRTAALTSDLRDACAEVVRHEEAFVDLAFAAGPVAGMTAAAVKGYVRHIADRRLGQLGLAPLYNATASPLPWLEEMLHGVEHVNFFEGRATEYSRAATQGTWDEVFGNSEVTETIPLPAKRSEGSSALLGAC